MTVSDSSSPFDPSTQELVLLVHGTFANNPSKSRDDHLRWWQAGGDVWNRIDEQLPEQFHVASDPRREVFSWSGDNSERGRRAGGRELFKHLQKLERKGTRYHLIGHSHGGSVIWHCLLESVKQRFRRRRNQADDKLTLPGLQSYTTIGTPFLQLKSLGIVSRISPWFWMAVLVAAMGVTVGLMFGVDLPQNPVDKAVTTIDRSSEKSQNDVQPASTSGEISAANVSKKLELLSAILEDPNLRTLLVLLAVFVAFFAMVMWAWASAVQLEASVVREGARIRNQAFVEFGARWLGIWSRHDEAINGLRASLKLGGHIAPRIEVSGTTVFDFDRRMRAYRFFARWFVAPVFNLMVSRPSDRIIWRSVSRGIQGNDRPGCVVSDISPGPIVPQNFEWEELPETYDSRLVEQSNKCLIDRSQTLLPQLREVLSQLAWSRPDQLSLLLANETSFDGNELVHTSYFHEPAVLKLIACHILRHNGVKAPRRDSDSSTARWCRRFRHKARDVSRDPSLQDAGLPLFGQRNIRAFGALVFALAGLALVALVWDPLFIVEMLKHSGQSVSQEGAGRTAAELDTREFGLWIGVLLTAVSLILGWTSIRRAKRGAKHPQIARWGWRLSRVGFVMYLLAAFAYMIALVGQAIGGA